MSKLLLPLLCLCLTVWLFGGSIWFGNEYSKSKLSTSWELQDGNTSFTSTTIFTFQDSDAEVILDDNQQQMLSEIANYLSKNVNRHLNIVGYHTNQEINNSDFDNLGKARAESFLYLLYRQGVRLEQMETSGKSVKSHQLNENGLIHGGVDFTFLESPFVKYGPAFKLPKVIRFETNSSTEIITKDFNAFIASLRQYLIDHPEKKILLTGFSNSIDRNETTRKRVVTIDKILTQNGIPYEKLESTIETSGENGNEYVELSIH